MRHSMKLFGILLVLVVTFLGCREIPIASEPDPAPPALNAEKMDGIAFVAPRGQFGDTVMTEMAATEAGWVQLIPYGFCYAGNPSVQYNYNGQWYGETIEGIRYSIRSAHQNGMKVLLKPHVWIIGQGWAGDYTLTNEADWATFESTYRDFVKIFAEVAEEEGVEMMCIGTEMRMVVRDNPGLFGRLADSIRPIYNGPLTYAANWDNYQYVTFWDHLDVIGIDAYFPLVADSTPSVEAIEAAWAPIKSDLKALALSENRPLAFTEWGYHSVDQAAWKIWEVEPNINDYAVNLQAQVNAFRAFFNVFWDEPWFAGGFVWHWFYNDSQVGGANDKDFTPQNKPSLEVLREFYSKQ